MVSRTAVWMLTATLVLSVANGATSNETIADDGTVHVPAFDMPFSSLASEAMREGFVKSHRNLDRLGERIKQGADLSKTYDEAFFAPLLEAQKARYAVKIESRTIAGVYTEVFTPAQGISAENQRRVLINLHGGGFLLGARTGGQVESIPIAATGRIKVISVDYRQGPKYQFPAATEDVVAVYRELLREYQPSRIGIYGCSAGGFLAAQSLVWFSQHNLPNPGAVGILGSGAGTAQAGFSRWIGLALQGRPVTAADAAQWPGGAYLSHVDKKDPLANPMASEAAMRLFPPTLFINGLQDNNWSDSVASHRMLVRNGIDARLHLFEGGTHCFLYDPELPESREAYGIIERFFAEKLAR